MRMLIAVAGPYSAENEEQREKNLNVMNDAAAEVYKVGHIPVIGMNNALPVVDRFKNIDRYNSIMEISLEIIDRCDAILMIGESPGANRERDIIMDKGLPVYKSIKEIPLP